MAWNRVAWSKAQLIIVVAADASGQAQATAQQLSAAVQSLGQGAAGAPPPGSMPGLGAAGSAERHGTASVAATSSAETDAVATAAVVVTLVRLAAVKAVSSVVAHVCGMRVRRVGHAGSVHDRVRCDSDKEAGVVLWNGQRAVPSSLQRSSSRGKKTVSEVELSICQEGLWQGVLHIICI